MVLWTGHCETPEAKPSACAQAPLRVTWLPAHPSEGSVSMARYWRELHDASRMSAKDVDVRCPLGSPTSEIRRPSRLKRIWHRYVAYPRAVRNFVDTPIVHILDHSSAHLIPSVPPETKVVVTVHDLIPLYSQNGLTDRQRSRYRAVVQNLQHADLLVADSQYTASRLQSLLNIPERKIVVVAQGVDAEAFRGIGVLPDVLRQLLPRPIILSIGSTQPRKNLELLPDVFGRVRQKIGDICLVRVGNLLKPGLREHLTSVLGKDCLVELGHVSEEELVALYQAASALIFPSFEEGFGLPLLEAMAAGCPVVSSNSASLPEVGGDAVVYFDPCSPRGAAEALARLLRDPTLADELRRLGFERASQFSWKRHFHELVRVYHELSQACE